jgi:dienelactone hydrolase
MNMLYYFIIGAHIMAQVMAQEKIQLPRPTGSYNVGTSTHFLKDMSRHHNDEKGRPLLVRIYYPSVKMQKEYPPYLADTMHLYKEKLARTYKKEDLEYLDEIRDWAMPDAPIRATNSPFPVLFFSPGFLMAAQLYSSLIEEMASQGYVVVAINHTDACWPVRFPNGSSPVILPELANIFSNKERSCMQTFDMTQETWIKDVGFVLAWLQNQPLTAFLDLSRMGIFGHSFGGSTAIEAARQYKAFKAVVSLDGSLFGQNWDKLFETPSLFVAAEKVTTYEEALNAGLTIEQFDNILARNSKKVFDQLKDNSFYVTIKNADHATFVDSKLIKSPLFKSVLNPLRGIQITRALLVDFFDHYLRDKKMTVLQKQNSRFPDIVVKEK